MIWTIVSGLAYLYFWNFRGAAADSGARSKAARGDFVLQPRAGANGVEAALGVGVAPRN